MDGAESIEELFAVIRQVEAEGGAIQGSRKGYTAEALIGKIKILEAGNDMPNIVSNTYSIRDKAVDLMVNEASKTRTAKL